MKKYKLFAPFLMLTAALLAMIVMIVNHYEITEMLIILLCIMIAFYFAGTLIQKKVHGFMEQILQKEKEEKEQAEREKEGEVIEKGASAIDDVQPEDEDE